jgi:uncharacterized membrane protein YcaP (DUF421 family)
LRDGHVECNTLRRPPGRRRVSTLPTTTAPGAEPLSLDWQALFIPEVPLEMLVRGTAMYWFLFVLFRVVVRRRVGAVGISDVLLLVIIADAAQNAMAGEYRSVADGMVLVATIVGWNVLIDWATYRSVALERLLEPPPLVLVRNGRILHRHLRMEFISEKELRAKLREHGVTDPAQVETAYMESDGAVSVIRRQRGASQE